MADFQFPMTSVLPPNAMGTIPDNSMYQPPQQDPYAALNAIINNLSNQPVPQAQPMSRLDTILNAIGQAIAVGTSQNPGEALQGQLKQQKADRDFQRDFLANRQNLMTQVKLQSGLQQANNLAQEQASIRAENRANTRNIAGEIRQEGFKVAGENRAYRRTLDLKEADLAFAERERQNALDFESKNEPLMNILRRNRVLIDMIPQATMEKIRMKSLWMVADPSADPNQLDAIADKLTGLSKKGLTPDEKLLLNSINTEMSRKENELFKAQVAELQGRAEYYKSGGSGGGLAGKLQSTVISNAVNEILKGMGDRYVKTTTGLKAEKNLDMIEAGMLKNAPRTTDAETNAENMRRLQQVRELLGGMVGGNGPTNDQNDTAETMRAVAIIKSLKEDATANYTNQQMAVILQSSGIAPKIVEDLLGIKVEQPQGVPGAPQASPTPKPASKLPYGIKPQDIYKGGFKRLPLPPGK